MYILSCFAQIINAAMQDIFFTLLPALAPVLLLIFSCIAVISKTGINHKLRLVAEYLGWAGIIISLISALIVFRYGTIESQLLGWEGIGLAIRLDVLSITMLTMISILGFVVLRFSKNYLDGDARQNVFFARLATTIASVELLVLSANLGQLLIFWVITSICLHYLLVFYRHRPQAIAAARKKFIVARVGDVSLAAALTLIYLDLGTADLDKIFIAVQGAESLSIQLTWASILLVITAALKSAQFPTHGWLIEVVETPTPVSALLHAGLLNAGPFLMVRMGYLMIESTTASILLIAIGGFTALFASVVFLTQPTIKVGLGYSSIAHMGFSLLICGFGVYSAAILHVVAHSFYKAHGFLSSGSVIDAVRTHKIKLPERTGNVWKITLSILASWVIFLSFCYVWGIRPGEDFNLMAIGAIIVMGLSQLITSTLDSKGTLRAVAQSAGMAFIVALVFFSLEHGSRILLASQLPVSLEPNASVRWAASIVIMVYAVVVLIQLFSPGLKENTLGYKLGVHLRNGLYANVLFDRVIGSLKHEKFKWANLTVQEEETDDSELQRAQNIEQPSKILINS